MDDAEDRLVRQVVPLALKGFVPGFEVISSVFGAIWPGCDFSRTVQESDSEWLGEVAVAVERLRTRVAGAEEDLRKTLRAEDAIRLCGRTYEAARRTSSDLKRACLRRAAVSSLRSGFGTLDRREALLELVLQLTEAQLRLLGGFARTGHCLAHLSPGQVLGECVRAGLAEVRNWAFGDADRQTDLLVDWSLRDLVARGLVVDVRRVQEDVMRAAGPPPCSPEAAERFLLSELGDTLVRFAMED